LFDKLCGVTNIGIKSVHLRMENFDIYTGLLNIPLLKITDVRVLPRVIEIDCYVQKEVTNCVCPNCQKETSVVNQRVLHRVRDLDISGRAVWLNLLVRQFVCKTCNRYFQEDLDFVDLGKSYTHRQAKYIFLLCKSQNYTVVGAIVDMCPKTVERLVLCECERVADVDKRYAQVRRLGIDEQSHRKGKGDYFCVFTDLDRGIVVDMIDSRHKDDIIAHFTARGAAFCAQITDVACDIWDAYIAVAKTCFPKAKLILDRFHVTKLLNNCLDTFRKTLRTTYLGNDNFKKLKWILFKQYHTLSDKQLDRLDAAIADCPRIEVLYKKREEFHHILDNALDVTAALIGINNWITSLKTEGITEFDTFVKMLAKHKQSVANYVTDYLSNAVTEGLNNLIRSIRRVSFGMTNFQHLRLRVFAFSD
jgi:transposase